MDIGSALQLELAIENFGIKSNIELNEIIETKVMMR
jgi:hypothetical protein